MNPTSPMGLGPVSNVPRPIHWGIPPPSNQRLGIQAFDGKRIVQPQQNEEIEGWRLPPLPVSFDFSTTYQFLDERSRVGGVSSQTNSVTGDLNISLERFPYTSVDLSYSYFSVNGSSPAGTSENADQHLGSLYVLQPIEPFLPCCKGWEPASLSRDALNDQVAVIVGANYGAFWSSLDAPRSFSIHSSGREFVGNALLDYQRACFPNRRSWPPRIVPASKLSDDYATLFFELTSGVQCEALGVNSSGSPSSASRQITYQNIAVLNYSFWQRFGVLVAVEWDAPIDSSPLRHSKSFYANTGIFTGGLTYNYYPGHSVRNGGWSLKDHLSVSLVYSYLAFDPFTEGNQLQLRFSYSF
jgi:hypothetical protein